MQRPQSQETAPSVLLAGTHHRRTPSIQNGPKPTGTNVISLLITNLRLLNLDLLPDWPGITTTSFGNQDARTRIRCTEFALFQLFRLYDPATTADKLQPFWPPLEPLQSINLRAALYRCLNELKKNGVLGKETVLRKTMLDECSGDKFWELCLGFSAVVLRKVTLGLRCRYGRPVAERLGTAQSVGRGERDSLLPLAVAHRASLGRVLEERQRKRQTFARLYDVLIEKEAELVRRKGHAQEQARSRLSREQMERLEAVEHNVKKHWVGSRELRNVLVNGDTSASGDGVLTKPLDQIASTSPSEPTDLDLLESLSQSANMQSQRMRRWQSMHETLQASKQASAPSRTSTDDASKPSQLRLDKHRTLGVRPAPHTIAELPPRQRSESHASATRYDEILTAMRDELRQRNRRATAPLSPQRPTRPAKIDHAHKHVGLSAHHLDGAPLDPHQRSPSSQYHTTVPMLRPSMSRRASSSRSRSYQQPKVISQRQPIPLKAELFSPLKGGRGVSGSPFSSSSVLASPVEEGGSSLSPGVVDGEGKRRVSRGSEVNGNGNGNGAVDSGVGLGIGGTDTSPGEEEAAGGEMDERSSDEGDDAMAVPEQPFKVPARPEAPPKSAPSPQRPSLAERTRMSMALRSSDDINGNGLPPSMTPPAEQTAHHQQQTSIPEEEQPQPQSSSSSSSSLSLKASRRTATLLDRTRHSIALAPPKKGAHARTRSSGIVYPVNQFATPPQKGTDVRRSSVGLAAAKRDITPREQLFSPDAEYDSVFKPRPKIAVSPVLSAMDGGEVGGRGSAAVVGVGGGRQ